MRPREAPGLTLFQSCSTVVAGVDMRVTLTLSQDGEMGHSISGAGPRELAHGSVAGPGQPHPEPVIPSTTGAGSVVLFGLRAVQPCFVVQC